MNRSFQFLRDWVYITLGVFSAGLGLKGFLLPNNFIDGGVTGISMLLAHIFELPLSYLIVIINAPFIFFGFRQIGKVFGIKTIIAISALALSLIFVKFPEITHDKLLAAVFGGFFLGAGIGLSIRGGSVLDGTEIMALIISKTSNITVGEVIFLANVVIFSVSAMVLDIETAMYSTITYLAASKTVNFIIHGIEEYTGIIIVSAKSKEVKDIIIKDMGRGVTIYKGKRGFTNQDQDIIFCVITRLEIMKLKTAIKKVDPTAFIVMHTINDTTGGLVKKQTIH